MRGRRAVVLRSGGLDSATALAVAFAEGFEPYAITFLYGQRHALELQAAQRVASSAAVAQHIIMPINSSLTMEMGGETSKGRRLGQVSAVSVMGSIIGAAIVVALGFFLINGNFVGGGAKSVNLTVTPPAPTTK